MNPEIFEHIESYLAGSLTRDELEELAQTLGVENLQEQIDFVKAVPVAFEINDVRDQIKQLVQAENNQSSSGGRLLSLRRANWIIGIAASVLIVVGVFWFSQDRSGEGTWLDTYHFQDPGIPVVMSTSDNYELYDALSYYSEGNYATTIDKLLTLQETQQSDTITYYLATSYYYSTQENNAVRLFEDVASNVNSNFQQRAQWFLTLIALNQNRLEDAQSILEEIKSNPDHSFYDKAVDLSESLNK